MGTLIEIGMVTKITRDRMLGKYYLVHYREIAIVLNIKLNEIIYQGPSTVLGT